MYPTVEHLGGLVTVMVVQVLRKYIILGSLDP